MLALAISGGMWPAVPPAAPAVLAWTALTLLWPEIGRRQRIQALAFVAAGLAALVWGVSRGAPARIDSLLGQNQPILSMLAAVTLLRLLNRPPRADEPELPRGRGAYLQSMLGIHAFGSVINISAVVIMADRLARAQPLGFRQAQLFSRAFSAVAFYSPFIGGVALALSYTPGSNPLVMMAFGIPLAAAALAWLYRYAGGRGPAAQVESFRGYPLHPADLKVPAALAAAVLLAWVALPEHSVLTLITMAVPAVVGGVLIKRSGTRGLRPAGAEYVRGLAPQMGGELALFLGAGVLAAGVVAAAAGAGDWEIFPHLDGYYASLLVAAFIATSLVCIHPAVLVGVTVALVETIAADPTLLATAFAMGWGLGCAVNPLSGVNVVLASRYGADNWRIARSNIAFSATLYVVAVGLLYLYEFTLL